jgi:hypothetical protein
MIPRRLRVELWARDPGAGPAMMAPLAGHVTAVTRPNSVTGRAGRAGSGQAYAGVGPDDGRRVDEAGPGGREEGGGGGPGGRIAGGGGGDGGGDGGGLVAVSLLSEMAGGVGKLRHLARAGGKRSE